MKYLIANWKSYVTSQKEAKKFFSAINTVAELSSTQVVVCPPFPFLSSVKAGVVAGLGSQDVFYEKNGAYTGEVTLDMLKDFGVEYVILGHSERRQYQAETDELINKKVKATLKYGLKVILCVGERIRPEHNVIPVIVSEQIKKDLEGVSKSKISDVIVAYEPIWAIGTGLSDTPENAQQAALYIRKTIGKMYNAKTGLGVKVLYGGSVNSKNILDFVNCHGIDGVLVGGASAKKDEFLKMIKLVG